jgi:uncharacterized protein YjbI with pentapeptide repeats
MPSAHRHPGLVPISAPLLLLLASPLFTSPIQTQDLNSDTEALLDFKTAFGVTFTSFGWDRGKSTCSWRGITCDSDRVTELRLPGTHLRGDIPQSTLGKLTALRVISLRFNFLTGPIPPELGNITALSIINLQGNSLSGEIPFTILSLAGLRQLNLAQNDLSGSISPQFSTLRSLQMLYLQSNKLRGQLPDLNMANLTGFNVSFNNLSGSIPLSLSRFDETSFLGMPLCGKPLPLCSGLTPAEPPVLPPANAPPSGINAFKQHGLSGAAVAGIVLGAGAGLLLVASMLILLLRQPRESYKRPYQVDSPSAAVALRAKEAMGSPTSTPRGAPMAARLGPVSPLVGEAAASQPRPARTPQRGEGSGSAPKKRLFFFGRSKKTYDLEDLLRASAEVLGSDQLIRI